MPPHNANPCGQTHYREPPSSGGIGTIIVPNAEFMEREKKRETRRRTKTGCLTCRKRRIKCDEVSKSSCETARVILTEVGKTGMHAMYKEQASLRGLQHQDRLSQRESDALPTKYSPDAECAWTDFQWLLHQYQPSTHTVLRSSISGNRRQSGLQ